MRRVISIYLLFLIFAVTTAICQNNVEMFITQLKSGDPLTVQEAKDNILIRCFTDGTIARNSYEQELIKIIQENTGKPDKVWERKEAASHAFNKRVLSKDDSLEDAKTAAILLVGELKVEKAIPALVKQINYVTPGRSNYPITNLWLDEFPAAVSLLMIGEPSIPYLREIIKKHEDRETRILAYTVVVKIQGKEDNALWKEARRVSSSDTPIKVTVGHFTNEKKKDLQRDNKPNSKP